MAGSSGSSSRSLTSTSSGERRPVGSGVRPTPRRPRDAEVRRRWRALVLVVKGKLEAVESEIVTFEEEFLAHLVLPNGQTVGSEVRPMVAQAYETGIMPAFSALALPAGEGS